MTLYDLNSKKTKYKNLKNDLNDILRILENSDFDQLIRRASDSLSNNYIINNDSKYSRELLDIIDDKSEVIDSIDSIITSIDIKIKDISSDIKEIDNV